MKKEEQKLLSMAINLSKIAKLLRLNLITEEEYYILKEEIEKYFAERPVNYD